MVIKILTTADIHIGRTSSGADQIGDNSSTRYAWERITNYAIEEDIHVLVIAGDIVEHANRYFEAASALEAGLAKLDQAGISVFLVSGNHDYDVLPALMDRRTFENVHFLGKGGEWEFKTVEIAGQKIQFTGWSFPQMHVKKDPLLDFPYSEIDQHVVSIGLIHGDYENKESRYAPLELSTMTGKGVDVWVMGHIHKLGLFNERDPMIYYPGSPHALSAKEKGEHGAVLLTVSEQRTIQKDVVPLSPVRYEEIQIEISECSEQDEIQAKIIDDCDSFIENEIDQNEYLELLSFDVTLTGTHVDISQLDEWIENWDIHELNRDYWRTSCFSKKSGSSVQSTGWRFRNLK
jgi:DNA repair protein SbcD/Mre11